MLTANRGEWSELYALFKIFCDKNIAAADENLNPIEGQYYRFIKVLRTNKSGITIEYDLRADDQVVLFNRSGIRIKVVNLDDLKGKTAAILRRMLTARGRTFVIPEAEELMRECMIEQVKSGSMQKADIIAAIFDRVDNSEREIGFSVKSQIGSPSTLLNASRGTNFTYDVTGLEYDIGEVNAIVGKRKVQDKVRSLIDMGATIRFSHVDSKQFTHNMRYTDSSFPMTIAEMLLQYYKGQGRSTLDLCRLSAQNLGEEVNEEHVIYRVKGFLRSIALGMVPNSAWNTRLDAYGGYLIVKRDGVVCYHLYNDDEFRDYLINNTRFDTPSTTRHNFGELYYEEDRIRLKLNLQIRFVS